MNFLINIFKAIGLDKLADILNPLALKVENFWNNKMSYLKINFASLAIVVILINIVLFFFLPKQNDADNKLADKYTTIAGMYDESTGQYKNPAVVVQLQKEVSKIENEKYVLKIMKMAILSTLMIVLIAALATLLQYLYTKLPFTRIMYTGDDGGYSEEERKSMMIVLASALLCATLAVCLSTYIAFS